ncbi:hypothetical protein BOTNAR_0141g00060 [Botryotinia narcissicola]|uniref:Uncharacterized protein n=1 Tax=Botryotinia narcissicola TaxID=278944 RepID=A0A4Z1IJJ5_9HELO|nr:hypothetical protein BOTNAR_0141g00060 [Botryotinia narcissicola]
MPPQHDQRQTFIAMPSWLEGMNDLVDDTIIAGGSEIGEVSALHYKSKAISRQDQVIPAFDVFVDNDKVLANISVMILRPIIPCTSANTLEFEFNS